MKSSLTDSVDSTSMWQAAFSSFEAWRNAVRPLLAAGVRPGETRSAGERTGPGSARLEVRLPGPTMQLLDSLACYRHAGRWELMYALAWRILYENPRLLEDAADRDVARARAMDSAVRRDIHKMHAFVRFKEIGAAGGAPSYFAWFEPQHEILRTGAAFFVKRFRNMPWTIATPDGAAVWDGTQLCIVASPPSTANRVPQDGCDDLWRTYYRSICNVARINPAAMQREMPRLYWRNLPEAAEIDALIRDGRSRFAQRQRESGEPDGALPVSVRRSLDALPDADALQSCRRCGLWKHATQAVEGIGPKDAHLMLVGEQPGDEEDLRGKPFVGPAGRVLDAALAAADIPREAIYITNAVKHFKWEPRGKRRLHKRPDAREIDACHDWLLGEIEQVRPRVVVALGATALRALTGRTVAIEAARMEPPPSLGGGAELRVTYHPSAVLRADESRAQGLRAALVADLAFAYSIATAAAAAGAAYPVT